MGWRVNHKISGRVLHPLNDEVMKEILENAKAAGAEVYWKNYEWATCGKQADFSNDIEIMKTKRFFDCFWDFEDEEYGEKLKLETYFSLDELGDKGFLFDFVLLRPYPWTREEEESGDPSQNYHWYIEKFFKMLDSYEIASMYAEEYDYSSTKNLEEWEINFNIIGLKWCYFSKIISESEVVYRKGIISNVATFVKNGEEYGCKFEPYFINDESMEKPFFIIQGQFMGKSIRFKIERNVSILLDEKPKNIRPYLELLTFMCKEKILKVIKADSLELQKEEEELLKERERVNMGR
jgi:hypothetical protein